MCSDEPLIRISASDVWSHTVTPNYVMQHFGLCRPKEPLPFCHTPKWYEGYFWAPSPEDVRRNTEGRLRYHYGTCQRKPPFRIQRYAWIFLGCATYLTGYLQRKLWHFGLFGSLFDCVTFPHKYRLKKRDVTAVKRPPTIKTNPNNAHAAGATLRWTIHRWIHSMCCAYGYDGPKTRYDLSICERDETFETVIGRRRINTPDDLNNKRRDDKLLSGIPVSAIDTLHYYSVRQLDEFAGHPIVFNSLVIPRVAWATGWAYGWVNPDSSITEVVNGGRTYKHKLWDPDQHQFYLLGWWTAVCYEQTVKHVDDSMQAIFVWTPIHTVYCPWFLFHFFYLSAFGKFVPRPQYWTKASTKKTEAGATYVSIPVMHENKAMLSVRDAAREDGSSDLIDRDWVDTAQLRADSTQKTVSIHDVSNISNMMGLETNVKHTAIAAVIAGKPGTATDYKQPSLFSEGSPKVTETHGVKSRLAEQLIPMTEVPAMVAVDTADNAQACIDRMGKAKDNKPCKIPEEDINLVVHAMDEIAKLIGPLVPVDEERIKAKWSRPEQRARVLQMEQTDASKDPKFKPTMLSKNEQLEKTNARTIWVVNTEANLKLAQYQAAYADRVKEVLPCYATGLNGEELTTQVQRVAALGPVVNLDGKSMDQSHSEYSRANSEYLAGKVFPGDKTIIGLLQNQRQVKVKSKKHPTVKPLVTSGDNISGAANTSALNTDTFVIFGAVACIKQHGKYDPALCGLYSGDDATIPAVLFPEFKRIASVYGFEITVDKMKDENVVKFLNRIWPSPTRSRSSFPEPKRLVTRFPTFTTASGGLQARIYGWRVSDGTNKLVQAICTAYAKAYDVPSGKPRAMSKDDVYKYEVGAFPYDPKDWPMLLEHMADCLEVSQEFLADWIEQMRGVTDLASLEKIPKLIRGAKPEGKGPCTLVAVPGA